MQLAITSRKTLFALLLLFQFIFLLLSTVCGQEGRLVKKKISPTFTERYYQLPNDKKVKHGEYYVMDERDQVLVKGKYNLGKKEGVWEFYSTTGNIVQKYDFNNSALLYYTNDSPSIITTKYELLAESKPGDAIDVPFKIGGDNYGFYLLYDQKKIPAEIIKDKLSVKMTFDLTISETGKLEEWRTAYKGQYYNKEIKESVRNLPPDAYEFSPARVNDKPIKSKILYTVDLVLDVITVPRLNGVVTH